MRSMILVPVAGALLAASTPTLAATKQTTMGAELRQL